MNAPATVAWHGTVSGRVQGVSYRVSTRREALRLGLTGYARNLADGRVEVLVIGDAAAVQALCTWLWRGPLLARVRAVDGREIDLAEARQLAPRAHEFGVE